MNSHQRRKTLRTKGKIINMNTVRCHEGHKARPTEIGYWCPKCQEWGNLPMETNNYKHMNKKKILLVIKLSIENLYLPLCLLSLIIFIYQVTTIKTILYNINHDEYPVISVIGYLIPLAVCLLTGLLGIRKIYKENK